MTRFGIVGRIVAIGMVGFLGLLTLLGILLYMGSNEQARFPLPRQIAAIVDTLDRTPVAGRPFVLAAVSTPGLDISIHAGEPQASANARRLPRLETLVKRGMTDPGRTVIAEIENNDLPPGRRLREWNSSAPLRVAAALADGNQVIIEAHGNLGRRLFGAPTGFWLSLLGFTIAGATLFALIQETRPLRRLTTAVERFSETASPVTIDPSGAADVRRLIETVNRMQQRLSTLLKGRTVLAGAISHDLKTYLTRLRLRIDAIENTGERDAAARDIDTMSGIVENALAFARSATVAQERKRISVADVVRGVAAGRAASGDPVSADEPLVEGAVVGDPVALRRVVENLVENALRYGHRARLSLQQHGSHLVLHIDDDGPGIPISEREAVFEPFYRLDPARNLERGGTGLGLALCRQIVESHGGTVSISDAPRGGARLTVILPTAR